MSYRDEEIYDITIIGGGPAGIFTSFYGGLRQCRVKVIESMPELGGQLAALYPEKYIYDVAGFPKIRARELVELLKKQASQFSPTMVLKERVLQVEKQADIFEMTTDKGTHLTKTIIITAGIGAFEPRRLDHPKAEQFEGSNIHYFINDLSQFRDKKVVVAGGGDSAVDWTLMLEPIAKEVSILHRREKFRAHESSIEQLKNSKIDILTPFEVKDIIGEDKIEQIVVFNKKTEEEKLIEVDELIVNFGFVSSLGPIKEWGLELEKGSIVVNSKMETNITGIYAVGDVNTYEGKVKLIATGFGEAPTAVSNAKVYLDPKARVQALHSTSVMGEQKNEKVKV